MAELTVPPKQLLTAPWYRKAKNAKKEPPPVYSSAFGSCNFSSPPVKLALYLSALLTRFCLFCPNIQFTLTYCIVNKDNYTPKFPIRQVFIPY